MPSTLGERLHEGCLKDGSSAAGATMQAASTPGSDGHRCSRGSSTAVGNQVSQGAAAKGLELNCACLQRAASFPTRVAASRPGWTTVDLSTGPTVAAFLCLWGRP